MEVLHAHDIHFTYRSQNISASPVLRGVSLQVNEGEMVAIQGASGSGKSTLLYMLGCLLRPDRGTIRIEGQNVHSLTNLELAALRNQKIGFVFQQFHLLPRATVLHNILLPSLYPAEHSPSSRLLEPRARELAKELGLSEHLHHFPNQLSGGQQQRVAIARALLREPRVVLADEPTGNLDTASASQILDLLRKIPGPGRAVILITHDPEIAKRCDRITLMRDGKFLEQSARAPVEKHPVRTPKSGPPLNPAQIWNLVRTSLTPAWQNVTRNRARSLLTMLGVVIGIASVLSMVTVGQYAEKRIMESYEALGTNQLQIRGWPNWRLKATDRTAVHFRSFNMEKDLLVLKSIFPEIRLLSPVFNDVPNAVGFGGRTVNDRTDLVGTNAEYLKIMNRELIAGYPINPNHVDNANPVCLIGTEIVKSLFANISPLDQLLYITLDVPTPVTCRIIGVLKPQTSNKEWMKPNLQIIMPYTAYIQIQPNWWDREIRSAALTIQSGYDVEATSKKIKAFFNLKYGKSGIFSADSDSVLLSQMKRFLTIFSGLLASIAVISLVVGGIGIMNMMLVSVSERTKEIGLRKAMGATDRCIRFELLTESVLLCGLAGLIGIVFGFSTYEGLIYLASQLIPKVKFEWIVDFRALFFSVFSILAVGIASGLAPAVKAERLQVIEALRSE